MQTSAPEVSLDLLDEWLNTRYASVLKATDWSGLKAHAMVQTLAAYQSTIDTITATVGSNAVTGLGTVWTNAITGLKFYIPGETVIYTATWVSGTALTLDRPFEGTSGTDPAGTVYAKQPYVFMQNVYPLPADCVAIVTVLDPITDLPMQPFTKDGLDQSVGMRALIGYPKAYAPYDDSPETTPPVLHQIELYPPPLDARGFPLEYSRAAYSFDGSSTSLSPLPFVSSAVLLAGARADIALHMEQFTKAEGYEAQYDRELDKLLLVEHTQRRVKASLKLASRFTRHRLARTLRGYGRYGGMPNPPTNQP